MTASLIPNPLFDYFKLFNLLLPVTSLLVAAGLLSVFQRAASTVDQLRGLVQVTAIVALLANFDLAVQTTKKLVHQLVNEELKASPELVLQKFARELMSKDEPAAEGWFGKVTNLGTNLFHALLAGLISLIAVAAMVFNFLAYLAQELALEMGIAFSPILVGFLLLPATRGIGAQFLLYMLAIALFPLGWGAASLVSDSLIDFATRQGLGTATEVAGALSFSMRKLFGALLLGIWMILSTLYAPYAILLAVTSGVHLTADAARATSRYLRS